MTSITDLTIEQGYMLIGAPACQSMIGGTFRIDHLTSDKGRTMNGKTCRVIGFTADYKRNPDMRLQCKLDEGGNCVLLKESNLVRTEANIMRTLMEGSSLLTDDKIMSGLRQGLAEHPGDSSDRKDMNHRIGLYKHLLAKLEATNDSGRGNALADEEYCFPCGATYANNGRDFDNTFDYMMAMGRPACVGNNQVDLRRMDLGLKGNGVASCSICTEVLDADSNSEEVLVTLPCVHMFHESCLREWLQSDLGRTHWNCPTCRQQVPRNLATYHVRYDAQLCNRFKEFLLSGFCPSCILWVMEKDRNQAIPGVINDNGEGISMGSVGQMQTGNVYACPPR